MKYWGPINSPGGIHGNDPYVNGNPSIGVQGSIPTFQSFEQTLRGLQNLVLKSGLTPDASIDDLQVTQAVRSQRTNWTTLFGGSNNALTATFDPAPTSLASIIGMPIRGIAQANNSGPATLTTNNLDEKPITHPDGTPLLADDIISGQILGVMYDGEKYQIIEGGRWGAATGPTGGSGPTGPTGAGGFDLVTQPYFFARAGWTTFVRFVGTIPNLTLIESNLDDAQFTQTGGSKLIVGPNTIGQWLFYITSYPVTTLTNKYFIGAKCTNPIYSYTSAWASLLTIQTDWADGFSNHITAALMVSMSAAGQETRFIHQTQYTTTNALWMGGIRIAGGPVA